MVGGTLVIFFCHVLLHKWECFCDCRRLKKIQSRLDGGGGTGTLQSRGKDERKKKNIGSLVSILPQTYGVPTPDPTSVSPKVVMSGIHKLGKKTKGDGQTFFVSNSSEVEEGASHASNSSFSSITGDLNLSLASKRGFTAVEEHEILEKRKQLALEIEQARRGLEECSKLSPSSAGSASLTDESSVAPKQPSARSE